MLVRIGFAVYIVLQLYSHVMGRTLVIHWASTLYRPFCKTSPRSRQVGPRGFTWVRFTVQGVGFRVGVWCLGFRVHGPVNFKNKVPFCFGCGVR